MLNCKGGGVCTPLPPPFLDPRMQGDLDFKHSTQLDNLQITFVPKCLFCVYGKYAI